jgi:hypothetical protein
VTHLADPLLMLARAADVDPGWHTAGWQYRTFAALVLDQGRLFLRDGPVDDDERGHPSLRWENAATWSRAAGLIYVEGSAAIDLLPFGAEHAWCARAAQARAYDPTWPSGSATCYIGLPVDAAWRARIEAPQLLSIVHDAGKALLRDEAGLLLPAAVL